MCVYVFIYICIHWYVHYKYIYVYTHTVSNTPQHTAKHCKTQRNNVKFCNTKSWNYLSTMSDTRIIWCSYWNSWTNYLEIPEQITLTTNLPEYVDRKKSPPPGGFPIYYVPSSRTVCKRTPLEGFVPGSSRAVLLHTVLDEGT